MKRMMLVLLCADLLFVFASVLRAEDEEKARELTRGRGVAFYQHFAPWMVDELRELRRERPEEFEARVAELTGRVEYYLDLHRRAPK